MRDGIRSVLLTQAVLVVVVAAVYLFLGTERAALSALYGGGVAVANALLLAQRLQRAGEAARQDAGRGTAMLYLGAVQRLVVTLVGLGVGMGFLGLDPLPMVIAFALAHAGYLLAGPSATGTAS
ncbi:MAG: ATP synthase subunit I [Gammaproteobacteria bacterium]|nr:ATP synthase subunit I [Gammaproteobacteria bacterium]